MSEEQESLLRGRLLIESIMVKDVVTVNQAMSIREVIKLFLFHQISGAPVVLPNNEVLTVVSHVDLLRFAARGDINKKLVEFFKYLCPLKDLVWVNRKDSFTEVFKKFIQKPVRRIIVMDARKQLQGIVTRGQLLKAFLDTENLKDRANQENWEKEKS